VESFIATLMTRRPIVLLRGLMLPSLVAPSTRGLVAPSLVAPTRGLVVQSLGLFAVTRGLVVPPLVAPTRGLVVLSWKLVVLCTRVARGHRLRARLVLEPLRVVTRLEPTPTQRPRRTAAAAIVGAGAWTTGQAVVAPAVEMVALAAPARHPIPGIRSPAIVVIVTAAVVALPPRLHVTAVAVPATAARARH